MVDFKAKRGNSTGVDALTIEDGSLILTSDKGQVFMDVGTTRVSVIPGIATDDDIISMFNANTEALAAGAAVTYVADENFTYTEFQAHTLSVK